MCFKFLSQVKNADSQCYIRNKLLKKKKNREKIGIRNPSLIPLNEITSSPDKRF